MYLRSRDDGRRSPDAWCRTKGVVGVRRADDGVGAGGRAAGRVAGRGAGAALRARARAAVRRRAAAVRARHGRRHAPRRPLLLRALRAHVPWRARFESQLGYRGRYVAGKEIAIATRD